MRRLAALLSIAIGVALFMWAIAAAAPRHLSPADANGAPRGTAAEEVEEEVEWEWGEEEGEEEFQVSENGELEAVGKEEAGEATASRAPGECTANDVTARVTVSNTRDTLRLAVRRAPNEPARITIRVWLRGDKGALRLRPLGVHLGRGGTAKTSLHLDSPVMARVRAAHVFLVHVEAASGTGQCGQRTRLLNARQRSSTRTTWSEPLGPALQRP